MKQYKYKFSVIIPVYNVERYIAKTIKSLIKQTIGFENIQVILVNDGSIDNSEKICLEYKRKYPNNIVYKKQKNSGVSAARNTGIKCIQGKYVSFLDGDDKWEPHAFERLYKYFEKHYNEIDLIDCRVKLFDGDNRFYIFDYKYKKTEIVDANVMNQWTLLNAPTAVYKAETVKKYRFDSKLKYSEDTKFVNQILLKKCKYGIKHDAIYLYRKRLEEESSVDKRFDSKAYFIGPLEYCFKELRDESLKQYGKVVPIIQGLILSNLLWRGKIKETKDVLTQKEFNNYFNLIKDLASDIDDELIYSKKGDTATRLWLLSLKRGKSINDELSFRQDYIYFGENKIAPSRKPRIKNLRMDGEKLIIHGRFNSYNINEKVEIYFEGNGKKYYAENHIIKLWDKYSIDNQILERGIFFRVEIPVSEAKNNYSIHVKVNSSDSVCRFSSVGSFDLSPHYRSYYNVDNKAIVVNNRMKITIYKYSFLTKVKCWFDRNFDLLKKKKIRTLIKKNLLQPTIHLKKRLSKTENIIVLESNPDFTDNTKALYDVLIKNRVNDKYKLVWLVNDPKEFENIKEHNVEFVKFFDKKNSSFCGNEKTMFYYKHAKMIIDENKFVKKFDKKQIRIHLNHGSPFKDAIAYNTNIGDVDALIVQSKFFVEKESTTKDTDKNKIYPLGFPRNDLLYKENDFSFPPLDRLKGKVILWLPTYRNHKASNLNTMAFPFGLPCINTKEELMKLNETLKKGNTFIVIKFHPAENIKNLVGLRLSNIKIIKDEELVNRNVTLYQLFTRVDALITDYSSVYFDFCLTKKNIGLAISDYDNYLKEQGEFQYNYKDTIVGSYMYNNKDLLEFVNDVANDRDKTYKERMKVVKKYDDYRDGKAAERVYEFIKKFL